MTGAGMMKDSQRFRRVFGDHAQRIQDLMQEKHHEIYDNSAKGKHYRNVIKTLPGVRPSSIDLDQDRIQIGVSADIRLDEKDALLYALQNLKPWRKGPFRLFGIDIDSEWRSDMKWNRLKDKIAPIESKRVMDIGSSCGYYMFRMNARQPDLVVGIEPYYTFYFQYQALQYYLQCEQICCLPCRIEEMPVMQNFFDAVFCMGILYHRKSPLDTLLKIRANLKREGELILETLIIEGESNLCLFPENRYAKMNNVYFIPTVTCLKTWLARTGFRNIRCVDKTRTTNEEQHKTVWVVTESLDDFLDPRDYTKTVEGYPAPVRAVLIANAN